MMYFHDNIQLKQSNQRKQNYEQRETVEKEIGCRANSGGILVTPIFRTGTI